MRATIDLGALFCKQPLINRVSSTFIEGEEGWQGGRGRRGHLQDKIVLVSHKSEKRIVAIAIVVAVAAVATAAAALFQAIADNIRAIIFSLWRERNRAGSSPAHSSPPLFVEPRRVNFSPSPITFRLQPSLFRHLFRHPREAATGRRVGTINAAFRASRTWWNLIARLLRIILTVSLSITRSERDMFGCDRSGGIRTAGHYVHRLSSSRNFRKTCNTLAPFESPLSPCELDATVNATCVPSPSLHRHRCRDVSLSDKRCRRAYS